MLDDRKAKLVQSRRRPGRYELSVDGIVIDIPESTTELDRVIVTPQMRGHRTVEVVADGLDFAGLGIRQVTVETLYDRPALGLRFADSLSISPERPIGTFEYDFAEGDPAFTYRVIHTLDNGLTRDSGWRTSSADRVAATVD